VGPQFLETCLSRPWPGNVREFLGEVRQAARAALDAGRTVVEAKDLSSRAGQDITHDTAPLNVAEVSKETIEAALRREQGNVTRAARSLGMHRNQLRRWLSRNNVDPKSFGSAGEGDG
jgi:transcriptional regulator of acetoin/glycerol metabolism